jgi:hypothetical protein
MSLVTSSPRSTLFPRKAQIPYGVSYGPGAFRQFGADERSSLTDGPVISTSTHTSPGSRKILPATRLAISAEARSRLRSSATSGENLRSQQNGSSQDPASAASINSRDPTNAEEKAPAGSIPLYYIEENLDTTSLALGFPVPAPQKLGNVSVDLKIPLAKSTASGSDSSVEENSVYTPALTSDSSGSG